VFLPLLKIQAVDYKIHRVTWRTESLMITNIIMNILFIILGLVGGSFASALSYRALNDISISKGRSFCPKCKETLDWKDLIPVFSWLKNKGKCSHCKNEISPRYPIIELATAFIFVTIYHAYDSFFAALFFCIVATLLVALTACDLEKKLLPIQITYLILPFAFIAKLFSGDGIFSAILLGLICHYGAKGMKILHKKLRSKDALGEGDIHFLGVAGFTITIELLPVFLVASGSLGILTGLLWKRIYNEEEFPFGPAMIVSLLLCIILHGSI